MKNRHLKSTKQSRSAEYQYLELGKEILANGIEQFRNFIGFYQVRPI
ncbi:MAG: hypothetical protein UU45_C0008G0013 [Candidatus Levybacteria bacterium GW2011_GWA2_41_15]|nr:MAG: hypothetical protein UU45_C0008G0013 [Candidatus Levybacteria bacterium GW2011_GWA2_41_15]